MLVVALLAAAAAAAEPEQLAQCVDCHGSDGMGHGNPMIPVIAGIPSEHIEEAIYAYVDGARRCTRVPGMCQVVASLSEDEVFELAEYFSSQTRRASQESFDAQLAEEGARLHREHCATCHVAPDDERAARAVGIPLHGQRREYLRYAIESYFSGDREALVAAMASRILLLKPGDLSALVHYYASYRAADQVSD